MPRYSIYFPDDMERDLEMYMKRNNIKRKTLAVKDLVIKQLCKEELPESMYEVSQKLNRLLHRQSMCTKLLEQLFVNMGFPYNDVVSTDKLLKEFYEANNRYGRDKIYD